MKKKTFILILTILWIMCICLIKNDNIASLDERVAIYINDSSISEVPKKGEAIFSKVVCDSDAIGEWDNDKWGLLVNNMTKKTKCKLYFYSAGAGGGATHIALTSGLLKNLGNNISDIILVAAGGGGFYGGGQGKTAYGSGGGSSYIGNPLLTNKAMYCYNCEESSEDSTKTISTTCSEENPTEIVQNKVTVMLKLL